MTHFTSGPVIGTIRADGRVCVRVYQNYAWVWMTADGTDPVRCYKDDGTETSDPRHEREYGSRLPADVREHLRGIIDDVVEEVESAKEKHIINFNSPHEGYSVILEELDELWYEVKSDRGRTVSARDEALQVAAMAIRYILDLDPHG